MRQEAIGRAILLSAPWVESYYGLPSTCIMCGHEGCDESYSHLFSDCPFATAVWEAISPICDALHVHLPPGRDARPARLIGDIEQFDLGWIEALAWDQGPAPKCPLAARCRALFRSLWTEVRGVVLHAIWRARCDVLHDTTATVAEARVQAIGRVRTTLTSLYYAKVPSPLKGALRSSSEVMLFFYLQTWGRARDLLLLPHHR